MQSKLNPSNWTTKKIVHRFACTVLGKICFDPWLSKTLWLYHVSNRTDKLFRWHFNWSNKGSLQNQRDILSWLFTFVNALSLCLQNWNFTKNVSSTLHQSYTCLEWPSHSRENFWTMVVSVNMIMQNLMLT